MADPASHNPQSLFNPLDAPAGGGLVLLYTSPVFVATERGTRIQSIRVCNHAALPVTFRLTHTEAGGAAAAAKALFWDFSVPADGVEYPLAQGIVLNAGDFLNHEAGAAASISVHGYGWEMTD